MIGGDPHNKAYYVTVASSSEGELSDEEPQPKSQRLNDDAETSQKKESGGEEDVKVVTTVQKTEIKTVVVECEAAEPMDVDAKPTTSTRNADIEKELRERLLEKRKHEDKLQNIASTASSSAKPPPAKKMPIYYPGIYGCRSINEFKLINRISEGTYGVVYRALERCTEEIVALKQLKMEKEKEGFPITSLREINMLMKCRRHPNVVGLREIVTDATGEKIYMVMEFVEHDMSALMKQLEQRRKKFTIAQVKTLLHQLLSGCAYMHDNWVIHRDLKTSNLLLSHGNILKIGDFGLAREYGDPLKAYTPVVVTLWYRSPELLLGCKKYSTPIDLWSIGCIFGEFIKLVPMFKGTSEIDQLTKIFHDIGSPTDSCWPGYKELPGVARYTFPDSPYNQLRKKFMGDLRSEKGLELLNRLLAPCPENRLSAEAALKHAFFDEEPKAAPPESLPTWPAKSENLKQPPGAAKLQMPTKSLEKQADVDPERLKLLKSLNITTTKATIKSTSFTLRLPGSGKK